MIVVKDEITQMNNYNRLFICVIETYGCNCWCKIKGLGYYPKPINYRSKLLSNLSLILPALPE